MADTKNTLKNNQLTKPLNERVPFKKPEFNNSFKKPSFNAPKFTQSFRTQNRGGGGK